MREQFLAPLRAPSLDSLSSLNEHFWHWLDGYHRTEHGATQITPLLRWQRDIDQVRLLAPAIELRRVFLHRVDRVVRRDSTFALRNRFFEAPPHLAGKRIEARFDPLDLDCVEIHSEGKFECQTRLVDAIANGVTYRNPRKPRPGAAGARRTSLPWEE